MKSSFLASIFHVASNKNNMYHYPHCPTDSDSWWKCNADRANNTQTYKPAWASSSKRNCKIRPIFLELSKDTELENCLHSKTQNANKSFNGTIGESIRKNTFVILPNLEFGVCDTIVYFHRMKASVLIYEKLNFAHGVYMLKSCKMRNLKRSI